METKSVQNIQQNQIPMQEGNVNQIFKTLQRDMEKIYYTRAEEDNEHRSVEMEEIRIAYHKKLDEINATNKERREVTSYIIGDALRLQYFDWVDEMSIIRDESIGDHIF